MPNLITRYTNGTFEGALGTWSAEFGFASTAQIQDPAEFYEGANSVRFTTDELNVAGSINGVDTFMLCRFPGVATESYEVTARIKVNDDIPDDAVFYIDPFSPIFTNEKKGYTVPVRASQAKDGWIELRANFYATPFSGDIAFQINVLYNSAALLEASEFFPPGYEEFYSLLYGFTAATDIPAGAYVWVDAMYGDAKAIPDLSSGQFGPRRLYYVENVFYIEVGAQRFFIEEPIKWDDVNIQIIFDEKTKAYRFEFSDKDVLLEFDNRSGRTILRQLRRGKGVQAEARLLFGEYDRIADELTIHYTGDINFEEAEDTETVFRCNIERQSFGEKLRSRYDKRVNIFAEESLGGLPRPELTAKELFLHPRLLSYTADAKYNENVPEAQSLDPQDFDPSPGDDGIVYTNITPFKKSSNNIDGYSDPIAPDGRLVYAGLDLPEGITKRRFFIECGMSFKYTKTGSPQPPVAGFGVVKISNISGGGTPDGVPIVSSNPVGFVQNGGILAGTYNVVGAFSGFVELGPDEALFFRSTVWNTVEGSPAVVYSGFEYTDVENFYLRIREQTVFAPNLVRAHLLHEVVNRQLELVTDKANVLRSTLLGRIDIGYAANGCAAYTFSMDGKIIRNLPDKPFNLSTKEWFNSLDALYCTAMSIERDEDDNEYVRYEELPYFFRDVMLLALSVISNYKNRPASKYLFSGISARFKKYPQDNQQDSIEDFHTEMNYITPLSKIDNDLDIQIDAILSGYYIEYTRRESFKDNPTNAYETDNDLFLIAAKQSAGSYEGASVILDEDTNTITVIGIIPAVPGDLGIGKQLITLANATGDAENGTFTIESVEIPYTYDRIIITVVEDLSSTGPGTADVTLETPDGPVTNRFEAERDEDFDIVTGVTFPKSAYNLKHHLKRVVARWAKVFQCGWVWAMDTPGVVLKFVEGKNNTSARTRLKDSVTCTLGDSERLDRMDSASEVVSRFDRAIFSGEESEFDAPLTWTTFNYIRTAFEGRNPDGKNYGYIQYPTPFGTTERGWVIKMKFKPNSQNCHFNLIVKNDA